MRPQHILNLIIIRKHSREQETAEEPLHREVEEKEEVTLRSSWLSSVFSPLSCLHILRPRLVSSGHGSSHSSQPEFVSTITDRRSDSSSTAYAFASTASLSHNKTEWMPCKSRSMKSKYLWSHSNLIRYRKEFWIGQKMSTPRIRFLYMGLFKSMRANLRLWSRRAKICHVLPEGFF